MKGLLIGIGVIVLLAIGFIMYGIGVSNDEIKLRNRATAQQTTCEAYFDNMWKILQQKAGVTDQYKDAFKEIYPKLMEGRYSDEGKGQQTFMKWIVESNPTFDISLYKDLMDAIEGQRNGFLLEQEKLIDIKQAHDNMRKLFPSSVVVGGRPELVIVIIKSLKTKEAYSSGEENDVDLFKKDK